MNNEKIREHYQNGATYCSTCNIASSSSINKRDYNKTKPIILLTFKNNNMKRIPKLTALQLVRNMKKVDFRNANADNYEERKKALELAENNLAKETKK